MKKILVLAVLMSGCFLPAFAQRGVAIQHKSLQKDSTLYQRALQNNLQAKSTLKYDDFQWKFKGQATDGKLRLPKLKEGNLNLAMNRPSEMEKMPCAKSLQKFRMPVSKPDSTVKNTMLIKKF